jgi:hypothetical protein
MRVIELFNKFPREVGLSRRIVHNMQEFMRYVELNNGVNGVYTSLYDTALAIDKVFFDIDNEDLQKAKDDAKTLMGRLNEYNLPYIFIFSGRKGFHVYIPLYSWIPPNIETARYVLKSIQLPLIDGISSIDRHVVGDVRRLARVPNTLNKNNYCVPLPNEFINWSLSTIIDYAKKPHDIDYDIKPIDIRSVADFDFDYEPIEQNFIINKTWELPSSFRLVIPLIRPCIAKVLMEDKNPPHMVRLDFVTELMWLGFSQEQIFNIIRELGWSDFKPSITRLQIRQIFEHKYLPPSCSRLKDFVRCDNCGWFYFWGDVLGDGSKHTRPRGVVNVEQT